MASTLPNVTDMTAQAFGAKFTRAAVLVACNTDTIRSALLPVGRYRVVCASAVFIRQGGVAVDATASDTLLPANVVDYFAVTSALDGYLAGIVAAGGASLIISAQAD